MRQVAAKGAIAKNSMERGRKTTRRVHPASKKLFKLDEPMVLLHDVVEVLDLPHFDLKVQYAKLEQQS